MKISDVIGSEYQFTQNIKELGIILQDHTEYAILCDLISKYCNFTNATIQLLYNKQYHFFYSKQDAASKDVFINIQTYNRALKRLVEKGYVTTFEGRNEKNKMFKITYFFLNLENIKEAYRQGYMLMHKKPAENRPQIEKKPAKTEPKLSIQQQTKLKEIERLYKSNQIAKEIYEYKKEIILNTK